jgi:hypothetical protein
MEVRYINKTFYCYNCSTRFKKLVPGDENVTSCPNCNFGFVQRFEEGEFNREEIDRTYRMQFNNGIANNQYHPVTDVLDRDPNNIYADPRRQRSPRSTQTPQTTQTTQTTTNTRPTNTRPATTTTNVNGNANTTSNTQQQPRRGPRLFTFTQQIDPTTSFLFFSPFSGSVNRQTHGLHPNDLFSTIFLMPTDEVFSDNFASNFTSNFTDPLTRIIFIQSMNENQPQGKPPASREAIKNLKRFKMSEEYCKKDKDGNLECPTCSVCMCEIEKDSETVLIPCGHLYHDPCLLKWLEMHNNCPVCRYELPTDDPDYEAQRNNNSQSRINNSGSAGMRSN